MRKILLVLFGILGFSVLSIAQNYREVVYLKNGSIIKGIIIEQTPNMSLKIKTADGSIFAYQMDEIEKMTKEEDTVSQSFKRTTNGYRTVGYRGFIEVGGGFGVGYAGDGVFSFQTSHGYQCTPYFYLGAGVGLDVHFGYEAIFMPIFANIRTNFLNRPITPFFDAKIGYSVVDGMGLYFNPNFGVSFGLNKKAALNLGIGYNMQMADVYYYDGYYSDYYREIIGTICFKLGVEF